MGNIAVEAAAQGAPVPSGAFVQVLRGFYEGLEVPVDCNWLVIGRGRGADVVLAEPTISRAHAHTVCQYFTMDRISVLLNFYALQLMPPTLKIIYSCCSCFEVGAESTSMALLLL